VENDVEARIQGTLRDGDDFDVVGLARGGGDASEPAVELDEEDVAQILYTSGTTSAPKGAVLMHRALMAEYVSCIEALEKPRETREAFEGGWFHSGDLGYFDEEGFLYVVDRVKDVINTGGIQVSGSEVEDVLFQHEAVSEVAVIGLPDEKWIEAISAVVVPRKDAETENLLEELQEHARAKLASFKHPKHIFFVDDLPRNAAGKILKRDLREKFGAER
jgi:acyl-CoA synthetase (AMP-forming)/AMP-acid ligase II